MSPSERKKKYRKTIYQDHHPDYNKPEWTIRLRMFHHLCVTRVQRLSPTQENIESIENLIKALEAELRFKTQEYLAGILSSQMRVSKRGKNAQTQTLRKTKVDRRKPGEQVANKKGKVRTTKTRNS